MLFGGRAQPGPAGGAYSAPPDSLAALKLLAPSALDHLTPSVFGDRAFRFFFFPVRTMVVRRSVESLSALATVLLLSPSCCTNEPAESFLRCKCQFVRSGQISEFHIFAPPNAATCTVPPDSMPLSPVPDFAVTETVNVQVVRYVTITV